MSINKRHVKGIKDIEEEYFRLGHERFVNLYSKYEVFTGMTPEIDDFLNHVLGENKEWIKKK